MSKVNDAKSTAVTFLAVGFLGILVLIAFIFNLLPLHPSLDQKINSIVWGIVFGAFFIIGLIYALSLKKIKKAEADKESTLEMTVTEFLENHKDEFQETPSEEDSMEDFFFSATSEISRILKDEHPEFTEEVIDQYSEIIYEKLFS